MRVRSFATMLVLALAGAVSLAGVALAQQSPTGAQATPAATKQAQKQAVRQQSGPFGNFGANSKDPIKIDADKLDVLDREGRAIYTGNVIAVQGETTVRCSTMTIFYTSRQRNADGQPQPRTQPAAARGAASGGEGGQGDAISKVECAGPVTVVSKTQTATAKNAVFDRTSNKVILTGDVAVADGPNITRGERIVYDTQTGVANVETTPGGRVKGFFVPGADNASKPATPGATPATPAAPARPATRGTVPPTN